MSRRRTRRVDALADRVADSFLAADLTAAQLEVLSEFRRRHLENGLSRAPEDLAWWCEKPLRKLYQDLEARAALAPYFYSGDEVPPQSKCLCCGRELRSHQRGRRPKYCDGACRQQALRDRKRADIG